jgi:hypothetical protein
MNAKFGAALDFCVDNEVWVTSSKHTTSHGYLGMDPEKKTAGEDGSLVSVRPRPCQSIS